MGNIASTLELLRDENDHVIEDLENYDDRALGFEEYSPTGDLDTTIYVHQVPDMIRRRILSPEIRSIPVFLLGASAIGKTDAVRQGCLMAAESMGRTLDMHELHASQMFLADVQGVPRDDGKERTVWYPPRMFALEKAEPEHQAACKRFMEHYYATGHLDWSIMRSFKLPIYFYDEVTNPSTPTVVHQMFSLWLGNRVADHALVDDAFHILAGNRVMDGTNSINLAKSAITRVDMMEVIPSLAGWLTNWALKPVVIGGEEYTREHPTVINYLYRNSGSFAPTTFDLEAMTAHPSPRTWSFVSRLMYSHDRDPWDEEILRTMIAGHIGAPEANQFAAWRKYWRDLPDVKLLLDSPPVNGGPFGWMPDVWPRDFDIQMMLVQQMAVKVNAKNAQRFMAFMLDDQFFGQELVATAMKMLRPLDKLFQLAHEWAPAEFSQWCLKYKAFML